MENAKEAAQGIILFPEAFAETLNCTIRAGNSAIVGRGGKT